MWAAALLCGGLVATATARRSGAWGLTVGGWFLWALLALRLGIFLPGGAIMLLLPTFLAGIFFAIVAFSRLSGSASAKEAAFIAASLGAGIVWLYLSLIFESAVGFSMSPAITLGLGLVAGSLAPLFALPQNQTRVRRWLLLATAVTMIVATVIAILVQPFSETDPQQVNLAHFDDRDGGNAFWTVTSLQGEVPEPLRTLFDTEPVAVFPWMADPLPVTDAQPTTDPAPTLEIISEKLADGERVVTGRLHSPRGADSILLHIPVEALISALIPEDNFLVTPEGDSNGYYNLLCFGRACEGLTVELHLKGATPVEILVVDTIYDLPPGGEPFDQARPAMAAPAHMGDESLIMTRVTL